MLFAVGMFCVFRYPHHEETIRLPDVTIPDVERLSRLLKIKRALVRSSGSLAFLIVCYVAFSAGSILLLWGSSAEENVPEDERQQQDREAVDQ